MKARIKVLLIVFPVILSLAGCWDAKEIKDYTLVSLVGIDKDEKDVRILLEVNSSSSGSSDSQGGTSNKAKILVSQGESLTDARNSYLRRAEKGIFLGSVRAIVFSDNFAKSGLLEYYNRIRGLREYNKVIQLFTTNTEMDKLLEENQNSGTNIGYNLEHLSESLVSRGLLNDTVMAVEMENALVKNTGYVLNNIDKISGVIEINGYSVFNDNKKVGFIPVSEMRGVNYFVVKKPLGEYTIDFEGARVAFYAQVKSKEIKAYYDNQNVDFTIRISLRCEIIDLSNMSNLNEEKTNELQSKISDYVRSEILKTIKISQDKFECDYLLLYQAFRERYNSDFQNMNWNEKYRQAKFNIEVTTKVEPANLVNLE